MAKGTSGRIVVEIDPGLKQELYDALGDEGMNLKQWFLENVGRFLEGRGHPTLPLFSSQELGERKL
ncbi:MAG: hypothetical protein L3J88_09065 [Gammaproteobacteria bacterium]|nr:hypothetical protein [Gammaproteobacteria bacterium]